MAEKEKQEHEIKEEKPRKKRKGCCLWIFLVFVAVIALIMGVMAIFKICPPAGPWPMPPWCSNSNISMPEINLEDIGNSIQNAANPNRAENILGYIPPTATVEIGTKTKVDFQVALPLTIQPVLLNLQGQEYPMESHGGFFFTSTPLEINAGDTISYYYISGNMRTETRQATIWSDFTVRDGLNWVDGEMYSKSDFVKGFVFMDAGGNDITDLKSGHMAADTLPSMKMDGGEWAVYDYYWSYLDYTIPEIVDQSTYPQLGYPTQQDLADMTNTVHKQGMKFALILSLEWNALPGTECESLWGKPDVNAYMDCQNAYWLKGRNYELDMLDKLKNDSNDAEALTYRDRWFAAYQKFMEYAAGLAEENNIDMLIIGKLAAFGFDPIQDANWRSLVHTMRQSYNGKIAYLVESYHDPDLSKATWGDALDYVVVNYWNSISDSTTPNVNEFQTEMNRFANEVMDPYYAKHQTPIIFMTSFQSHTLAATGKWVEPFNTAPEIIRDFMIQADLYEIFFETMIGREWFKGTLPYGYWFFDGFHPDFAFDRSYNVRNKPGGLVIRSWFGRIENQ
jgi:hypothetical protein